MQTTIYGKKSCTYCDAAKQYLDERNIIFDYHSIDTYTKEELKKLVTEIAPGATTVPIVIINGEYIGGYEQLKTTIA